MNTPLPERRENPELREMFVEVYAVLEPFFDDSTTWAGQSHEHLAYRALHERFPQLSGEQVYILVTAAKRVFHSGGRPTPA